MITPISLLEVETQACSLDNIFEGRTYDFGFEESVLRVSEPLQVYFMSSEAF